MSDEMEAAIIYAMHTGDMTAVIAAQEARVFSWLPHPDWEGLR